MLQLHEQEEEDEVLVDNNNFPVHLISSPASTCWQIQQFSEPDMFSFDCSTLPASPMEEMTPWTYSWIPPPHHDHQESAQTQAFDAQLREDDVSRGGLPMNNWRCQILPDSRQRIANKIIVTLRRHHPVSGQEELMELRKIALRFEEKIFTAATSPSDYLRKIALKMLTVYLRKIALKMLTVDTKSLNRVYDETVQVVDESSKVQLNVKSPLGESTLHNLQSGEERAPLDPFQQRSVTEHGNLKRKGDTGPSGQDHTIFELGNKQKMDKKLKKTWGIGGSISLDDLKQHFGKKRDEAAESLDVSVSTLKRICRENGISRWPSKKIKRDRHLLSNLSINETVSVAGGGKISISTTPTAFASNKFQVKSNQQKSGRSNLSLEVLYDVLGNDEGTDGENIMIPEGDSAPQEVLYKTQEFEPCRDSFSAVYSLSDAPMIPSPIPEEIMPAEDSPDQQGEEIARQIHVADGTSHLEEQYLRRERLCNSVKEVIVSVEDSSLYDFRNVSEPNQDHLADFAPLCEVDKDQLIFMHDVELNCIKSQSMLESTSKPSLQNNARGMKSIFEKLITLPLEDLTNPNHEASMKEALTILAGNLSLFADEQGKQLLELKLDFPTIMSSWRDCSQSRIDCRNFLAEFENTKSLLETSTKDGEVLKGTYIQLESKEKEMMAQLEAIQKEKNEISKLKSENLNRTKHLAALAEEQAGRTKEKELQMTIAGAKLDKLKSQWFSVQSFFN